MWGHSTPLEVGDRQNHWTRWSHLLLRGEEGEARSGLSFPSSFCFLVPPHLKILFERERSGGGAEGEADTPPRHVTESQRQLLN